MDIPFYRALTLQIMKARQENINVFISNPIPLCITGNLQIGKEAFLGAKLDEGHLRIVRSAKGYFKPNYFLETNLGDTIQTAWEHPFLNELNRTDYLPDLCQRCPVLELAAAAAVPWPCAPTEQLWQRTLFFLRLSPKKPYQSLI